MKIGSREHKELLRQEAKKRAQKRAIEGAIRTWTRKKRGVYYRHEEHRYSAKYCDEQIAYFKKLKFLSNKKTKEPTYHKPALSL